MLKIATHDSATGEKGKGFLSWLVTPFSKTQSKTIKEQYDAGCRSFDIRAMKVGDEWICAHGLWKSERTLEDIIREIALFEDRCQVCVTYEGKGERNGEFVDMCLDLRQHFKHIIWGYVAVKYGKDSSGFALKYDILVKGWQGYEGGDQGFLPLDGRSWHTYLPIPWLWDRLYKRPHRFNEERFTYVDFL